MRHGLLWIFRGDMRRQLLHDPISRSSADKDEQRSRRVYVVDTGCKLQWFIATADGKTVLSILAMQSDFGTTSWVKSTGFWISGSSTSVTSNIRTVCTGAARTGWTFNLTASTFMVLEERRIFGPKYLTLD